MSPVGVTGGLPDVNAAGAECNIFEGEVFFF